MEDMTMLDELQKVMDKMIERRKEQEKARELASKCRGQEGVCYCENCMNEWRRHHSLVVDHRSVRVVERGLNR
jgi:hypothetical protein